MRHRCPAALTKIGATFGSFGSVAGRPVFTFLKPAKNVAEGMNAVAIIEGGGMLANGFANWNDAGVVVVDSGWTVNGAANEFCRMF